MTEPPRRLLAVDYGDSRTGLAATDWTGSITVPLPRIDERDVEALVAALVELVRERETQLVVLGMPLCVDGSAGERAQKTRAFERRLAAALPCPVVTVDESHTTDEAHERLKAGGLKASKRKQFADSIAALVILERYKSTPR
jgi:putative Holliday junction resolvase